MTQPESIEGERGIPSVNRVRSLQSRMSSLLALGFMGAVGLGLLGWYYARTLERPAVAQQAARADVQSKAQGEMPLPSLGKIEPPVITAVELEITSETAQRVPATGMFVPVPVTSATSPVAATKGSAQIASERRLSGAAFAPLGPIPGTASALDAELSSESAALGAPAASAPQSGLGARLNPTVIDAALAQRLPTPSLLLPKGAFIDCTLETAIDSTLPGMTTCITATDTFSADGSRVLIGRGSKLIGETQGQVQRGAARLFVLWTEARTPEGVVVPLASPGTDELGRSGLPGAVNRHFLERFGAAILISVIDGAVQAAAQPKSDGGTVIYSPTTSTDLATEALESSVDIPPTIVKPQGDRIQILVARDLDFRSVHELRTYQ